MNFRGCPPPLIGKVATEGLFTFVVRFCQSLSGGTWFGFWRLKLSCP